MCMEHGAARLNRDAIVQTTFFHDLAVDHLQHRGAGEVHFAAGCGWQTTDQEVVVSRARVGAATFPLAHHVVTFGDQVGRAPEVQVRERLPKSRHEGLDIRLAAAWFM